MALGCLSARTPSTVPHYPPPPPSRVRRPSFPAAAAVLVPVEQAAEELRAARGQQEAHIELAVAGRIVAGQAAGGLRAAQGQLEEHTAAVVPRMHGKVLVLVDQS